MKPEFLKEFKNNDKEERGALVSEYLAPYNESCKPVPVPTHDQSGGDASGNVGGPQDNRSTATLPGPDAITEDIDSI